MRPEATLKRIPLQLRLFLTAGRWFGLDPSMPWVLHHRREVFGSPIDALMHGVMRGTSAWSVGERELFGAVSAKIERCPF